MHLKTLLARYGIRPQKRYGQHFLVNRGVIDKIVAAVAPQPTDRILEIGPGIGILTEALATRAATVVAVETDPQMILLLRVELGACPNLHLYECDILDFVPPPLPPGERYIVVGNIPYQISSPILFWLVAHRTQIATAILTMQREVVERVTASPGTPRYGALTVGIQAVATARQLFIIQPRSFWPAPRVTSATVRLTFPDPPPHPIADAARFRAVVARAFQQRRKMLRNRFPLATLHTAGIDPTRRPETLTVTEFATLTQCVDHLGTD